MKLFSFLTHPALLALSFSFLLIYGEKFSFFYISVLLLGLAGFFIHCMTGLIAVMMLLIIPSMHSDGRKKAWLSIVAAVLQAVSLGSLFSSEQYQYNWETFRHTLPLCLFILFAILWAVFVSKQIKALVGRKDIVLS